MTSKKPKGRRARKAEPIVETWKKFDRVTVEIEGSSYSGQIKKVTAADAAVRFDDGDELDVPLLLLRREVKDEFDEPDDGDAIEEGDDLGPQKGFVTLKIVWLSFDGKRLNFVGPIKNQDDAMQAYTFTTAAEGFEFHGNWAKTRVGGPDGRETFVVYMTAKRNDRQYLMPTLERDENDPRSDIRCLNGDICASIRQWLHHYKLNGDTVDRLQQRAENPELKMTRVEDLDRTILALQEYRYTLLHSGGERRITIQSSDGLQRATIAANFTTQARILDGKPPGLMHGVMLDDIVADRKNGSGGGKGKRTTMQLKPKDENVQAIVESLKKAKADGDDKRCRQLRGVLRKMGHRGGGRSATPETPQEKE